MCYNKEGVVVDRREMLRVKAKSLAEEARIIRKEELKSSGLLRDELRQHRLSTVRLAARETYLAYGIIRGTPVEKIEKPKEPRKEGLWKNVRKMVEKYGPVGPALSEMVDRCKG